MCEVVARVASQPPELHFFVDFLLKNLYNILMILFAIFCVCLALILGGLFVVILLAMALPIYFVWLMIKGFFLVCWQKK